MAWSLCFVFLVFAGGFVVSHAQNITIEGNDEPLISDLEQDITCIFTGSQNVSMIEWVAVVAGFEFPATKDTSGARVLILTLTPMWSSDGAQFKCRVVDSGGRTYEETILISVKNLEHTLSITASASNPVAAGSSLTLQCVATSDRVPRLKWIDSDGNTIQSGNGITVSITTSTLYQLSLPVTSTITLTFNTLRTSHAKNYTCRCDIDVPSSTASTSYLVTVQIPAPSVTTVRDPDSSTQLYTTDSLVLTCLVELDAAVDTPIAVTTQWSVTPSPPRVTVVPASGVIPYSSSIRFSSLQSSDIGTYVCTVRVTSDGNSNVIASLPTNHSIYISAVLKVTIEVTYNPSLDFTLPSPPYYHPASSVTLTCRANHATGSVSYQWSSTCSSCFASSSTAQTISETILKSNSAGVHICTATDSDGNTGSNSTEMRLIGAGLYVRISYHVNQLPVSNNSLIVQKPSSCRYCKIDVYCYSNSTSSSVGYYKFPNNERIYSDSNYYDYTIERIESGIRIHNYDTPNIWGIFTCELPDSDGNTVETSIGIYSSMPSAPSVYSSRYSDLSNTYGNVLGSLECLTQYSPPTNVTWLRDGIRVHVDGERYEMIQSVIGRQSIYNNTLLIRDAADLAGVHIYTCIITNSAGTTSESIHTRLTAYPVIRVFALVKAIFSEPYKMTCRASLNRKVALQLIQYMVVEWVSVDGQSISEEDGVTIEQQQTYSDTATQSLIFDSVKMAHEGTYKCVANFILPNSAGSFNASAEYHLNVLNRTLIQLKFGPVVHCSKWYEDKGIALHLERNIKETLTSIINKNCSCGFQTSQIDEGEFSCRTLQDMVMYRAHLTGNSDTLTPPELLSILREWVTNDGTFLYTYHGRMRLGLDQQCPLEITSFSQPECNGVTVLA